MFFERPQSGERAVLVHITLPQESQTDDPREFEELALSAGADPAAFVFGHRSAPSAKTFVGSGKLAEIAAVVAENSAELVLFNHALTPSQERNLEKELKCRVLDRTGLILDIFAQRARTHEGKLQVELAQLEHMSTRLVRGWTHLERQKGGIGLRGPGETQLETDRRLLRARITSIKSRLERVRRQRDQGRRGRQRADVPTVALVGYTNAGKSTLFNRLSGAGVYAADQLFATLDPTLRRLTIDGIGPIVLADTVGFIRHLPHKLVDAFRATLEETRTADLLLHVIDASSEDRAQQMAQVEDVLHEIGADTIPRLDVFNKIDLLEQMPRVDTDADTGRRRVWLSAQTGKGCELLTESVSVALGPDRVEMVLTVQPSEGRLRAALYRLGAVREEQLQGDGSARLDICLARSDWERLQAANTVA